jgi:hypothetical protein
MGKFTLSLNKKLINHGGCIVVEKMVSEKQCKLLTS